MMKFHAGSFLEYQRWHGEPICPHCHRQSKEHYRLKKVPVVGLLSDGKVQTFVTPNISGKVLKAIIYNLVKEGTTIISDGWKGYVGLSAKYDHKVVDHGTGEYVRDGFHTNSIEGFWSHLKRGIMGIYHKVSKKHLFRYCDEFAFRYNTRNFSDEERFSLFIMSTYKRIRYHDLISLEY